MSPYSVACPQCQTSLQAPKDLPAVKKCPRCGHKVTFTASSASVPVAQPAPRPTLPRTPPATASSTPVLYVAMVGVLVCVLAVVGVVLASWATNPANPPDLALKPAGDVDPPAKPAPTLPEDDDVSPTTPKAPAPALKANDIAAKNSGVPPAAAEFVQAKNPADGPVQPLKLDLTADEQRRINQAIANGVRFLKQNLANEAGKGSHPIGRTAFAGFALLECGVPANDPVIAKAARSVRSAAPQLRDTYSLALAALFLNRLGDPQDEKWIRTFAGRLIAGQNGRGGWTYNCPLLSAPEEERLLTMLRDLPPLKTILSHPIKLQNPLSGLEKVPSLEKGLTDPSPGLRTPLPDPRKEPKFDQPLRKEGISPSGPLSSPLDSGGKSGVKEPSRGPEDRPLPPALRNIPALQIVPDKEVKLQANPGPDDNSNTQFAMLGLWAARKHGVPMERTLALIERRFRSSQNPDGSWGYHFGNRTHADSMTCTGLLGMALALGVDLELQDAKAGEGLADPAVKKGLAHLSRSLGKHAAPILVKGKAKKTAGLIGADAHGDLYYLWSVERVALCYGLAKIENKDWYHWGARLLVGSQHPDGSWKDRFPGLPDTSFALCFLMRANPARGLPQLAGP